jgi:DNA excision repair protein ERCC-4
MSDGVSIGTKCRPASNFQLCALSLPTLVVVLSPTAYSVPSNFHFPALRSLGQLADHAPTIVIDMREQNPLVFGQLQSVRGMLVTGDYSIQGLQELFSVERKSVEDLVGCCMGENRLRFERELHRLRGFRFKRLLVVGSRHEIELQCYHSRISPKSVLGSLAAWEVRFDLPVVFASTPGEAADQIERWAWYFAREVVEATNDLWRAARLEITNASDLQQHAENCSDSMS